MQNLLLAKHLNLLLIILLGDSSSSSNNSQQDSSNKNLESIGLAVFKNDKYVGSLSELETLAFLIVSNRLDSASISISNPFDEDRTIELNIRLNNKTKINIDFINGSPYIKANVSIRARLLSVDQDSNYLDPSILHQIENSANLYISKLVYDYFYKTSKEYNSDIATLGRYAVKHFSNWEDWTSYNWLENYKDSFFSVTTDTTIRSSFLLM